MCETRKPSCTDLTFLSVCTGKMLHWPFLKVSSQAGRHNWGEEEEPGWWCVGGVGRTDGLSSRNPFSLTSVILPIHTHTRLLPPPHNPTHPYSLFSPFSSDLITDVSSPPPPSAPSHQVSFESSAPALQNSIVCQPAWGCLSGLGPFFFQAF